ncbi:MAG: MarR family transcriptional regulator [Gammaproteobacteria bacterium]|nr:MarR family transcriptional regulator [Gammaproteobacteria bacterium]
MGNLESTMKGDQAADQFESLGLAPGARPPHKMPPGHPTPVRVLLRGLELIRVLSSQGPLTTAALSQKLRLARTTVNRCLATLEATGFVSREEDSRRFSLTLKSRTLSHGFDPTVERLEVVRHMMRVVAPRVRWPMSLMSMRYPEMFIEDSTDRDSGFAVEYFERGMTVPVLMTASGRAFLAFSSAKVRESVLESLWAARTDDTQSIWTNRADLDRELTAIRERGYAKAIRPLRITEQGSIAVPVMFESKPVGIIAVRFALSAVTFDEARKYLLPALLEVAQATTV